MSDSGLNWNTARVGSVPTELVPGSELVCRHGIGAIVGEGYRDRTSMAALMGGEGEHAKGLPD
jgi:hypothetical protein